MVNLKPTEFFCGFFYKNQIFTYMTKKEQKKINRKKIAKATIKAQQKKGIYKKKN
jgi:hypothetical protein